MSSHVWWYVARAAGVVAWLLLTASVLWGVVLASGAFPRHRRPAWLLDLHRWLGGLTVGFVALHVAALVADSYSHFGVAEVLIPFASSWRPGAVALGVVAAWLLVAVEVTSLAMRRIPRRIWHLVHLSSYATFLLTGLHGALAGTDQPRPLYQVTSVVAILAVAGAGIHRLIRVGNPARRPRATPPAPAPAPAPTGPVAPAEPVAEAPSAGQTPVTPTGPAGGPPVSGGASG
jgi:DMSO/TMAO reductase YedYZ heme-binding membrane subunit